MNDEESFEPLEERLADEAQRLLADSPRSLPLAGLRVELARRSRRRMVTRALCATATVVAAGLFLMFWKPGPGGNSEHADSNKGSSKSTGPSIAQTDSPHEPLESDLPETIAETGAPAFMAIAILMSRPGDNGEPEVVPGWYVPGRVEEIDAQDLSPAERSAVSQLLELDFEISDDDTI
ncbi:MAG: hypothetical protein HY290_03935 [Planctomycetia bacterium]|nr:hypothetical protein [Planctomycetia bacterium]